MILLWTADWGGSCLLLQLQAIEVQSFISIIFLLCIVLVAF